MKNLIIRRGKKEDIEKLWPLIKELILSNKKFSEKILLDLDRYDISEEGRRKWLKNFNKWFKLKSTILFVAEISGEIVGFIWGKIYKWNWSNRKPFDIAKIGDLVVLRRYRKRGIGKRLMNEFESLIKNKNICFIEINLILKNKLAYNIYRKMGYRDYTLTMFKKLK